MAAFIPALVGLGSALAGGIGGLVSRRKARKEIEGTPLAARALAEQNARNIQRQVLAQPVGNVGAALRNASQLGAQERTAGNFIAAREQNQRNEQVAQLRIGEGQALQQLLAGLGGAGATLGAQVIASSSPDKPDAIKKDAGADGVVQPLTQPLQPQRLPADQILGQQQAQQQAQAGQALADPNIQPRLSINDLLLMQLQQQNQGR